MKLCSCEVRRSCTKLVRLQPKPWSACVAARRRTERAHCLLCTAPNCNCHLLPQVGGVLGALVSAGVLSLKEVATTILRAASKELGDDGKVVGSGSAWKLMGLCCER